MDGLMYEFVKFDRESSYKQLKDYNSSFIRG